MAEPALEKDDLAPATVGPPSITDVCAALQRRGTRSRASLLLLAAPGRS